MNKNYIFLAGLVGASLLLSFEWNKSEKLEQYYLESHKNTGGAPSGRTGAPGEGNCTSCHTGATQSGNGFNTIVISDINGPVTEYVPGDTYAVVVSMTTSSGKNGFEILALNSSNAQAGTMTITDATHTKIVSGSAGKKYVTHTTSGTTQTTWTFNWTAPATNVGNVTFYLATNETNSANNDDGDLIRLSNVSIGSTVGVDENSNISDVNLGYASTTNSLNVIIDSKQNGTAAINILDMSGKSVQFEELGSVNNGSNGFSVKLNNTLPEGMYVAHISVNNQFVTKKFYVN